MSLFLRCTSLPSATKYWLHYTTKKHIVFCTFQHPSYFAKIWDVQMWLFSFHLVTHMHTVGGRSHAVMSTWFHIRAIHWLGSISSRLQLQVYHTAFTSERERKFAVATKKTNNTQTKPAAMSLITVSWRLQWEGKEALKHSGQLRCIYRLLRTNQLWSIYACTANKVFSSSNMSLNSDICMFPSCTHQQFLLISFKLFGRLCSQLLPGDSRILAGGGFV